MVNPALQAIAGLLLAIVSLAGGPRAQDPPAFAFVGLHGGIYEVLAAAAPAAGVRVEFVGDDALAAGTVDLSPFTAVLVQHLRVDARRTLGGLMVAARAQRPGLRVLMLSGEPPSLDGEHAATAKLERDAELQRYYGTSKENLRRLLGYLRVRVAGGAGEVEPPIQSAAMGAWHPEHEQLMDGPQFAAFLQARGGDFARRPRVAVTVHSIHLAFQQPAVVAALVRKLEAAGLCAFGIVDAAEGLQALRARYEALLQELAPDAVVHTCHSTDRLEQRVALDVPHLHSLFFRKKSIDEWRASPDGLDPSEVVFQVATQELLGAIEPTAGAGTLHGGGSAEAMLPIDERLDHLVARTRAWVHLRRKPNADKRIAVVYQDRGMNKADLMRGSATGMHLNAVRSLLAVLQRLGVEGYSLQGVPADEAALVEALIARGRQITVSDPSSLRTLVEAGAPVLLPVSRYEQWLRESVPAAARQQLLDRWGPAPGKIMTTTNAAGEPCFVIPRLDFGSVIALPQPLRGEAHDNAAIHDKKTCPPHHYVATYLWLQHELRADAVVHFGTHGSEIALPGKGVGLGPDDWPEIVLGTMPNISPWIVENLGEAMVSKRRTHAVLIGHLPPPAVDAGLHDELLRLHDDLDRFVALGPGALKERFRRSLSEGIRAQKLDIDLHLQFPANGLYDDAVLQQVDDHLHRLSEETTPVSLHVLGQRPSDELLIPHLVSCLRAPFRNELAALGAGGGKADHVRPQAEQLLRALLADGEVPTAAFAAAGLTLPAAGVPTTLQPLLQQARTMWDGYASTDDELDNFVRALAGRFIAPGPGRGPMRNPGVLPTGRNLYSLNPEEVPSKPSWELGKQLAEQLLASHRAQHGRVPVKVAFSLSSFATFQDFGVMESQILWLLGCEPIWDEKNLVRDVRVVPAQELGRPRVDVFLSALSYYRDNLPSRMLLLDRAIRAVGALDEADNQVRAATRASLERLLAAGESAERAAQLANARIFGYAPGQGSAANYYYLVERSGEWDSRAELMQTYMQSASHVYTDGAWGEPARAAYEAAMTGTEVVLRTWYDSTTSPLANKYAWFTGGSLAMAIETVTGKQPQYVFTDVRDEANAKLIDSVDALRAEFRVRLFNRKWIEGMMREGYAGADQMQVMTSNVFGWATMREGSVGQDVWADIKSVYLDDKLELGLRKFFAEHNPFAEQLLAGRLLEAARKGYWRADAAQLQQVAQRYLESVAQHGSAGGLEAGKGKVKAYAQSLVQPQLAATPEASAAAAKPVEASAPVAKEPQREHVVGQKLERAPDPAVDRRAFAGMAIGIGALLCFLAGFLRRPS